MFNLRDKARNKKKIESYRRNNKEFNKMTKRIQINNDIIPDDKSQLTDEDLQIFNITLEDFSKMKEY